MQIILFVKNKFSEYVFAFQKNICYDRISIKILLIMFIVGHIFIIEVLGGKFYGIWKDQR